MTSIHIEHRVNDLEPWLETFSSFASVREQAGVTDVQVRHGVADPNLVAVDLEFGSYEQATSFLSFLETEIWPKQTHFTGTPHTQVLESLSITTS